MYINERCVLGCTQEEAIGIFQSIPVGQLVSLRVCRGYPMLFDPNDEIVVHEAYPVVPSEPRSHSDSTLRPSEMLLVHIQKGNMGFGFTIADSPYGQKVKKILDKPRCGALLEGDVLCEINAINVRKMSHADIVDVLRDCPVGQKADILVQRSPQSRHMSPPRGSAPSSGLETVAGKPVSRSERFPPSLLFPFILFPFAAVSPFEADQSSAQLPPELRRQWFVFCSLSLFEQIIANDIPSF